MVLFENFTFKRWWKSFRCLPTFEQNLKKSFSSSFKRVFRTFQYPFEEDFEQNLKNSSD